MRYGTQYTYRCPQTSCRGSVVYPHALPAAAAIDWTPPAQRIRDRRKPLQPRTPARIAHGLRRYGSAMLVPSGGTWNSTAPADHHADARPHHPRNRSAARPGRGPYRQTGPHHVRPDARADRPRPGRPRGAAATTVSPGPPRTRPLVTFAAGGTHQGLIMRNNTGGTEMSTPPEEQFRTFTTAGHQSLVRWDHLTYAHDTGTMRPVAAPLPTQVVVPGDALIRPTVQVDDCTFRMLGVDEIRAGMPSPTATGCSAPNAPGCGCSATPSPHPQPATWSPACGGNYRFSLLAPGFAVRAVDFDDPDLSRGEELGQPGPVGAGALDPDGRHRAEAPQPRQQGLVPGLVGRELFGAQHAARAVQRRSRVRVLVGIHTTGDVNVLPCHRETVRRSLVNRSRAGTHQPGEADKTVMGR
jgi:hypothetical protein